jgi:hypothetical protein
VPTGLLALILTEQALVDAERLSWCSTPFVWCCPQARPRPCLSAGVAAGDDPLRGLVLRRQPLLRTDAWEAP